MAVDVKVCREWEDMYHLAEIQLSLMYDIFYSKTELMHTWYGYYQVPLAPHCCCSTDSVKKMVLTE